MEEQKNLNISSYFTLDDEKANEEVYEVNRSRNVDVSVVDSNNKVLFEQDNVCAPYFWSDRAIRITASKYFSRIDGNMENSIYDMVDRVVNAITAHGRRTFYFDEEGSEVFRKELRHIMLSQRAAFNSPVYFNVGVSEKPTASACFINSVEDSMESIMDTAKNEAVIFKNGSGSGLNVSKLRAEGEELSRGGVSTGPLSFMKGWDAFAGSIKSGGRTRRAAKMVIMNDDHPDLMEFIKCKVKEEEKAKVLVKEGYSGGINGEAYGTVTFQNANNAVRLSDQFMNEVDLHEKTGTCTNWLFANRTHFGNSASKTQSTKVVDSGLTAKDILYSIADSIYKCGDPGVQFHDVINEFNTCPHIDSINATNPCSEFHWIDNSACNLASLNLKKFVDFENESFLINDFIQTIRIMIIAMDILVEMAQYPNEKIRKNVVNTRPLGLGYTSLGETLMRLGIPYDSPEARFFSSSVTSLMTSLAYQTSIDIANELGPYTKFNKENTLRVVEKHASYVNEEEATNSSLFVNEEEATNSYLFGMISSISDEADDNWEEVKSCIETGLGVRNSQLTLLAPAGTISFMMDADTTGIEPVVALKYDKSLAGGGKETIVFDGVDDACYSYHKRSEPSGDSHEFATFMVSCISRGEEIPYSNLNRVLQTSLGFGYDIVEPLGHIQMCSAIQPLLSGGISKTVNVPNDCSVEEIYNLILNSWRSKLKSITFYRDGSKESQPLMKVNEEKEEVSELSTPVRVKLPTDRKSLTHRFSIAGHEGYLTVGMYEDGTAGEVFLRMAKAGSVIAGFADGFALMTSLALQYGVPIEVISKKFAFTRFEPSGFTENPDIPIAKSILDYVARWLSQHYVEIDKHEEVSHLPKFEDSLSATSESSSACEKCGGLMARTGTCYTCLNCGASGGCSG